VLAFSVCAYISLCLNVYVYDHVWMCTCMTMSECVRVWPCLNVYVYDHMSHGTPVNTSYHTNKWGKAPVWKKEAYLTDNCTGWRRLIRCLKLQVIYRKRATDYRALLRKMTMKIGILWLYATHYHATHTNASCHTYEWVCFSVSESTCVWPYESSFHMSHLFIWVIFAIGEVVLSKW